MVGEVRDRGSESVLLGEGKKDSNRFSLLQEEVLPLDVGSPSSFEYRTIRGEKRFAHLDKGTPEGPHVAGRPRVVIFVCSQEVFRRSPVARDDILAIRRHVRLDGFRYSEVPK